MAEAMVSIDVPGPHDQQFATPKDVWVFQLPALLVTALAFALGVDGTPTLLRLSSPYACHKQPFLSAS